MAVQPYMKWIPIKLNKLKIKSCFWVSIINVSHHIWKIPMKDTYSKNLEVFKDRNNQILNSTTDWVQIKSIIHNFDLTFIWKKISSKRSLIRISLTLSLPGVRCAGPNTNLLSNSNISKTLIVNTVLPQTFFKEYSIRFLKICRLIDFQPVVL